MAPRKYSCCVVCTVTVSIAQNQYPKSRFVVHNSHLSMNQEGDRHDPCNTWQHSGPLTKRKLIGHTRQDCSSFKACTAPHVSIGGYFHSMEGSAGRSNSRLAFVMTLVRHKHVYHLIRKLRWNGKSTDPFLIHKCRMHASHKSRQRQNAKQPGGLVLQTVVLNADVRYEHL